MEYPLLKHHLTWEIPLRLQNVFYKSLFFFRERVTQTLKANNVKKTCVKRIKQTRVNYFQHVFTTRNKTRNYRILCLGQTKKVVQLILNLPPHPFPKSGKQFSNYKKNKCYQIDGK